MPPPALEDLGLDYVLDLLEQLRPTDLRQLTLVLADNFFIRSPFLHLHLIPVNTLSKLIFYRSWTPESVGRKPAVLRHRGQMVERFMRLAAENTIDPALLVKYAIRPRNQVRVNICIAGHLFELDSTTKFKGSVLVADSTYCDPQRGDLDYIHAKMAGDELEEYQDGTEAHGWL